MKYGLAFASSVGTDPQSSLEICRHAESLGFESVWGGEHVIRPDAITSPYPYTEDGEMPGDAETAIPDPLVWLAYVAAAGRRSLPHVPAHGARPPQAERPRRTRPYGPGSPPYA